MATAVQSAMTMAPTFNHHAANQCVDPDHDFFDFGQLPSPTPANLKREASAASITSPTSIIDDELQTPAKPSHEYDRFKQQTGLPSGSIAGLAANYSSSFPMFSSSGLDDIAMMGDSSMLDRGWSSGLPVDAGMNVVMNFQPPTYFAAGTDTQDEYVDPSAIVHEDTPNIRVWPGVHQRQAAIAKAQAQAEQQRQQQLAMQRQQAVQQQHRLQSGSTNKKNVNPFSDARTEETIARVVAQIRANSQSAATGVQDDGQGLLPHIIRAKKDEEDMDEDERLLASEEGKKLTSKERRQLRNKVSARAFRSRRKEYIGQLEGEVAMKNNEANELRAQNRLLMEENARSRAFIERLLRHQAFVPFLDDLSREESLQPKASMTSMPSATTPASASFQSQPFNVVSQPENTHVGMTLIPDTPLDFSMLNLNNNNNSNNNNNNNNNSTNTNWNVNSGFNFQQPRVFAVLELPEGPAAPLDAAIMSGKGYDTILNSEGYNSIDDVKHDHPFVERPVQAQYAKSSEDVYLDDEEDLTDDLFAPSSTSMSLSIDEALGKHDHETPSVVSEKDSRFQLILSSAESETYLADSLARRIKAMEATMLRISELALLFDE